MSPELCRHFSLVVRGMPAPFNCLGGPPDGAQITLGSDLGGHRRAEEDDIEASQHRSDAVNRKGDAADASFGLSYRRGIAVFPRSRNDTIDEVPVARQR